ncbi:hypothetical protein ACPPVO_46115 [Dactylosporangium sp. McL0621]
MDALGERGRHTRTSVAVPGPPFNGAVEVQVVFGAGAKVEVDLR